jgi:hypothetical protein
MDHYGNHHQKGRRGQSDVPKVKKRPQITNRDGKTENRVYNVSAREAPVGNTQSLLDARICGWLRETALAIRLNPGAEKDLSFHSRPRGLPNRRRLSGYTPFFKT